MSIDVLLVVEAMFLLVPQPHGLGWTWQLVALKIISKRRLLSCESCLRSLKNKNGCFHCVIEEGLKK